ncbi:phosphotransferase family protein [Phaeobacter gallaeciensis]|uniref:Phosphotransferase family protein n=2 Tax=Roseobacteraceae TaxID=2854170 RepID=A0A366WTS5_9RHOB|nr:MULTISPECIES: phosphotransferase family protein [Roseobacteraceae]MBT3140288.1 phosphotransferase family protein [Falsiruegeria litorea]MBT8171076.1 phosphotransferase family protein [Falsiruegeria litorea]RBW53385.1 phosphotransferase family protein [Phaeobacter gallaeciensis]
MSNTAQTLDLTAVDAYLSANLPGYQGPLVADKFATGQSNPTFLLKTPTRNYVLRRKPPGVLLKSAHAVDREFRVQRALADSEVPVAKMHLLCEDDAIIGSSFYIMDHLDGRNFSEPTMPDESNETRTAVIDEMNRVLAALHMVDIDAIGLSDYGPPGNYFERQIGRWSKQYRASETDKVPEMDQLIEALQSNMPVDDGQRTLVHGDYRIDNMMFEKDGTKCLGILDWELSTIGHPYADLAAVIMQWQMPVGNEGRGMAGINRVALGLPSDAEFIAKYCERRSLNGIENFGFYLSFNFFRMAAIIQGVLKRALDGNASNPERAMTLGQYVPVFAKRGLEALDM